MPDLEKGLARINYGKATPSELLKLLLAFERVGRDFVENEATGLNSFLVTNAIKTFSSIKDAAVASLDHIDRKAAKDNNKEDVFISGTFVEITDAKDHVSFVEIELSEELQSIRKILKKPSAEYISVAMEEYLVCGHLLSILKRSRISYRLK